jgi:simple sugar transport system ATP-binding protein
LIGITKRFPGVVANDHVDLAVEEGEIHAICGENGAGKSTLMKILYGMYQPDEGVMKVLDEEVHFTKPTDAINLGIGMVHQHFMLAENLTVLESVILGAEPTLRGGRLDFASAKAHLREVSLAYGLDVNPDELIETLEVGERQRVEIIKVLYRGAKILILDEPTAVLVPQEVEALFQNIRELKAKGSTILFIDHKLDEVLAIADTITVLRQGQSVATVKPADVTAHDLSANHADVETSRDKPLRQSFAAQPVLLLSDILFKRLASIVPQREVPGGLLTLEFNQSFAKGFFVLQSQRAKFKFTNTHIARRPRP